MKPGKLNKGFFALNKAKDKNDYIIFKSKTGVLSYDADGSGKAKAVDFAVLRKTSSGGDRLLHHLTAVKRKASPVGGPFVFYR